MTEQQTLVEFVKERLDEDEEAVKLIHQPYRLYIADDGVISEPEVYDAFHERAGEYQEDYDGSDRLRNRHNSWRLLYDPARVLRDVAAKRAIIKDHLEDHVPEHDCAEHLKSLWPEHSGCYVIGQLAAVYSDHPDYREAWKP